MHTPVEVTASSASPSIEHEIGLLLSEARQEQGLSLEDVARDIHIRKLYLAAIEQGQFDVLPGRVYTYGFIRKYAEYLGLDTIEFQRRLNLIHDDQTVIAIPELFAPYEGPKYRNWVLASLVLTLLGISAWYLWHDNHSENLIHPPAEHVTNVPLIEKTQEAAAPEPSSAQPSEPQEEKTIESEKPTEAAPSVATETPVKHAVSRIVLRALEPTWVDIRNPDGSSVVTRVLQTGERFMLPQTPGLKMNVGNAGGLEVLKNDVVQHSLGKTGQVRKDLNIDTLFNLEW